MTPRGVLEIDIDAFRDYARQKNVGLVLWVIWRTLDGPLQPALDKFETWGVKGTRWTR